jgi:hypothetical protein
LEAVQDLNEGNIMTVEILNEICKNYKPEDESVAIRDSKTINLIEQTNFKHVIDVIVRLRTSQKAATLHDIGLICMAIGVSIGIALKEKAYD